MSEVNKDKISALLDDLIEVFNKHDPEIKEAVIAYGNLGYSLGSSFGGYKGKGPDYEELEKAYYTRPTIDLALMLQGLLTTMWAEDYDTNSQLSQDAKEEEDETDTV